MREPATVVMAPGSTRSRWRVDHWFYISVALFMIVLNVAAFAPSLVNSTNRLGPPTPLVAAHGTVSFAFLPFFLTQTTLVATGRTIVHRRFGLVGAVLAVAMIVLTYAMSIEGARRGYDLSGDLRRLEVAGQSLPPEALRAVPSDRGIGLALNVGQVVAFGFWWEQESGIDVDLTFTSA